MKLQKRFLREIKGKKYYKFVININPKIIKKVQLKEGDKLEASTNNNKIVLKKK